MASPISGGSPTSSTATPQHDAYSTTRHHAALTTQVQRWTLLLTADVCDCLDPARLLNSVILLIDLQAGQLGVTFPAMSA
jgi:hypothetical protein